VSEDFLKSLKRFWGGVCAETGKCWAEETVKPLFWVESMFDFAFDAEKKCCHFTPINTGTVPIIIPGTVPQLSALKQGLSPGRKTTVKAIRRILKKSCHAGLVFSVIRAQESRRASRRAL
jgi:hypothetical protein